MRDGKPFAAWVHKVASFLGAYGGLCCVVFLIQSYPARFGLVAGTFGPAPDEAVLGRPGHARKAQAVCAWLRRRSRGFRVKGEQDPRGRISTFRRMR